MSDRDAMSKTIADFGEQWTMYVGNAGRYGSTEYFFDIVSPLLSPEEVQGATVADIGSGTGRIVLMLLGAGASKVHAIEPSAAFDVLKANTAAHADGIVCHRVRGDEMPIGLGLDLVVSIGVIHHIPEPMPTMRAAFDALRNNGRCVVWLYGYEGNEVYLAFARPLRLITTHLPHAVLAGLCHVLNEAMSVYAWVARWLPVPLGRYVRNVFATMDRPTRYLTIYDQLNPTHAKYYRRDEAHALLAEAGFVDIALHHRHGYSWLVAGRKP